MKKLLSLTLCLSCLCACAAAAPPAAGAKPRNVTFISTSDSHFKAFESKAWNEQNRVTIEEINRVASLRWPDKLGGGKIDTPRGVVMLGDCIDDGDKVVGGKDYTAEQYKAFITHFGLDGRDGLLKFRVYETWGNHDGPPVGKNKMSRLSFQAELKKRNALRKEKGWLANLSDNGLHYSWNFDDVHMVSLGFYPADRQHAKIRYNPTWHDPQGGLTFLKKDLAKCVGDSGRPVVLMSHAGFDSDWWHAEDYKAVYEAAKKYNVVLYLYGHTGTGLHAWAPEGETRKWTCINDGHTTSGFFIIQIEGDRIRAAYRCKMKAKTTRNADRTETRQWSGQWGWKFPLDRKIAPWTAPAAGGATAGEQSASPRDYNVKPVPFSKVHVADAFWGPRLKTSRTVTIPYAFEQCQATDRISNFEKSAGFREGGHKGARFNDSDVYKIMEGAAYSLQVHPDRLMRLHLDQLIRIMAAAQWEDGYLFTPYSIPKRQPEKLWSNIASVHEQYCVGHMYEAAAAHYEVTGDKTFLDVARKNADLICRVFNADKRTDPPGHQEIEIGLCKLYRVTGDQKYLNQAKFFLDQRGRKGRRGRDGKGGLYGMYSQDHVPVVEQTKAVGHSVRAAYLYTGMADVAALTGDMGYVKAINAIWEDVVKAKLYVTGGIGAAGGHEGFGGAYELPNMTAYCETCASIANILWNHRMFLMHGDAKYVDVLERTMYNAALSGISMEGDRFFYPNVLESVGGRERSPWFGCACCPSNVARFIPSVPGFAYARKDKDLYVNLFVGGKVTIDGAGNKVTLVQETRYPWEGKVKIAVQPAKEEAFTLCVRIPGWARNQPVPSDLYSFVEKVDRQVSIKVNGREAPLKMKQGYARIERTWKTGDTIELDLPMPVRRVVSHAKITSNKGKVALQRGPVVYCLEGIDNDGKVLDLVVPDNAKLATRFQSDLLGGVVTISGQAGTARRKLDGEIVPDSARAFTAIPYYAWAHRGRANMTVWPARVPAAARPKPADTLTYISKTTASYVHVSLDAIKDQNVPANSADSSGLQLDFWPHSGTTEWVQFEWKKAHELASVKVYWFDDTGRGACHLPKSWRVLYKDANGEFKPVKNRDPYGIKKDAFNKVRFDAVKTSALKLEIVLQAKWAAGIQEVVVEPAN